MPAVVVGIEIAGDAEDRAQMLKEPPDGVLLIDQQAGGRCMTYPVVVGVLLPLAANADRGGAEAANVIEGLREMESSDGERLGRTFPNLRGLHLTWGDPYDPADLDKLRGFVSGAFHLPPFESGVETFVRCVPADPFDWVRDWRVFSCRLRDPDSAFTMVDDDGIIRHRDELIIDDQRRFDEALYGALRATAERIGADGNPHLFLLWSNSD